jgi:hypothetical protein
LSWLFENPTLVLTLGGIAAAVVLIAFFQSGRGIWLVWLGAVLVIVAALWLLERIVVTEREQIENTFYAAAAALEGGDTEAVLAHVAPSASSLRNEISSRMRSNRFEEARITDLAIEFADRERTAAHARASGRLSIRSTGGLHLQPFGRVRFALVKSGDRWLFTAYELERGL